MRKILAIILCTVITLSGFCVSAEAEFKEGPYTFAVTDGKAKITLCDKNVEGELIIPDTLGGYPVTEIGTSAFEERSGITAINIPQSVHTIGYRAFYYCRGLKHVKLNEGLKLIGSRAFMYTQIEDITLPETLAAIGDNAFHGVTTLKKIKIPDSVCIIGTAAFCDCRTLEEVNVPKSLTNIMDGTFFNCFSLESIYIHSGITEIGVAAFGGCISLKNVKSDSGRFVVSNNALVDKSNNKLMTYLDAGTSTEYSIEEGVEIIDENAFRFCSTLEKINIPSSVKTIGNYAFDNCKNLKEVDISYGVTEIGDYCFQNCESLDNVVLPDSLETIGHNVFEYCKGLKSLSVPFVGKNRKPTGYDSGLKYLFDYYTGKADLEKVTVTDMEYIPQEAFAYNFKNLREVCLSDKVKEIGPGAFIECKSLEKIEWSEGITKIGGGAFEDCYSLEEIVIPEGVTDIGTEAFYQCTKLKNVALPQGLETIGARAFAWCDKLEDIAIPESVKKIGANAFSGTPFFKKKGAIYCGDTLVDVLGSIEEFTVKEGTVHIGESAFNGAIKNIVLPDSLRTIGKRAFANCEELQSLVIPEGVTEIGEEAFYHCDSLKKIRLPETLLKIDSFAFSHCKELKYVYIPRSVKSLGKALFEWNEGQTVFVCYGGTSYEWEAIKQDMGYKVDVRMYFNTPLDLPSVVQIIRRIATKNIMKDK